MSGVSVFAIELVLIAAFCDAPLFELDEKDVAVNGADARESGADFEAEVDMEDNIEGPAVL